MSEDDNTEVDILQDYIEQIELKGFKIRDRKPEEKDHNENCSYL